MNTIKCFALCSLLLIVPPALAQSTTVSATVVDQSSTVWANGSWALDLVPNPNSSSPPYWNGNPLPSSQWHYSGALDANGQFSQSVPSNSFITPAGSTYTIKVCPNATAPCSEIIRQTFQGTAMNISSVITANTPAPIVKPLPLAVAYNDSQVSVNSSQTGYFYLNNTTLFPRYWDGNSWNNFGGGISSIGITSFNPLFTTTVTSPGGPGTLLFTFNPQIVAANKVYAECTGSNAFPSFCSITNAMLPATLTGDTTGNATTATALAANPTDCSANQFANAIDTHANLGCVQPGFTNLSGNIAMGQIANGLNANASHYLRGDNTWATLPAAPTIQSASAAGCTTGSTSFSFCNSTVTWPSAFADTGYQAVCQGNAPNDPRAYIGGQFTKTTTTMVIQTVTAGSNAVSYSNIDCIAIHP